MTLSVRRSIFEILDFKNAVTLKTGLGSVKIIENVTILYSAYDFLLSFCSNYGSISYRVRDKRRFPSKIARVSTPRILGPCWRGSPRNWVLALGNKKTRIWGYRAEEEVWRYLQPSGYNIPAWQTDRQTDTGRQQRPRLRIASRGKNGHQTEHVKSIKHMHGVKEYDFYVCILHFNTSVLEPGVISIK